ncbi:High-affinity branched-chain amino acid transport system permease protein LivH (TC 3.A.1.4.1) [hydrothermal vent metagenome]|uniref:High-affinity branched-chain amino acid transport system permease protein LivH (TC 3.A.1.4.1) n=1 Tax=hydrothermal vent metagenome TaxID=652676 RepID=A0A3B0TJ79_9ZZZZ
MTDILNALVLLSNFVLLPALSYGSQLALGALGVTLVFGILRFANFAHGDLMAFGTMVTIFFTWALQGAGIGFGPLPTALIAVVPAIVVTAAFALGTDRLVYRFYRAQGSPPVIFVVASVGVMFVLGGLLRLFIGPGDRRFSDGEKFIVTVRGFREATGLTEGLVIRTSQGLTVVLAMLVVVALFYFLSRSRMGKAMRAYSDNRELAQLSGIDPERVVAVTWIIAASLATIAGVLYGLDKSFKPFTYFQLLLPFFAAAIVGGIGSPAGAIVGGYIVAFSEVMATYAYKKFLTYLVPETMAPDGLMQFLSTDYKFAISFLILVIVLLIRPTGVLKGKVL